MNECMRNKPSMSDFTGIDLTYVNVIENGFNDNGEPCYAYNLEDLVLVLNIQRKELIDMIPGEYIILSKNTFGHDVKYIVEEGVYLILIQLDVEFDSFRNLTCEVMSDYHNYGVVMDSELKELFESIEVDFIEEMLSVECDDYVDGKRTLFEATFSQIK